MGRVARRGAVESGGRRGFAGCGYTTALAALPLAAFYPKWGPHRLGDAYFARRRTLCALVMAEAVTGAGSYLPAIADLAWAICEESAWQLPAHNSYIRDTPQLPLPDVTRPIVDLFAAETGALIATVYGLLGAALDGYAPGFSVRLKGEVERLGADPAPAPRISGGWATARSQCATGPPGVPRTCRWPPPSAPRRQTLPVDVKQAADSIDCSSKDYGEDGCCSEGGQHRTATPR